MAKTLGAVRKVGRYTMSRAERDSLKEQLEAARTLIRSRCFMCEAGIPRRECEPFDMHSYTVSGLHSWHGNDRMFCGISTEEAHIALDSYSASRQDI